MSSPEKVEWWEWSELYHQKWFSASV